MLINLFLYNSEHCTTNGLLRTVLDFDKSVGLVINCSLTPWEWHPNPVPKHVGILINVLNYILLISFVGGYFVRKFRGCPTRILKLHREFPLFWLLFLSLFCCIMFKFFNLPDFNLLTPNVNYSGHTAPLTSKVAFYIFIQQIYVLNILNTVYNLRLFLFKMQFVS